MMEIKFNILILIIIIQQKKTDQKMMETKLNKYINFNNNHSTFFIFILKVNKNFTII